MTFRRVLLSSDGSRASLEAGRRALEAARLLGAEVLAIYVVTDGDTTGPIDVIAPGQPPAVERLGRSGEAALTHLARLAADADVAMETRMLHGDPVETILQVAGTWEPDLIVLGRSGRHGPGSAFLGSVTEHVLEFSEVPVLVVPAG